MKGPVALVTVGAVVAFVGLWMIWPPVALVASGGGLLAAGLLVDFGGG